ncbi:MAG: rhamnosyltransferase subunit [Acidobacteriota bacterium]|jgi:UDP:flavonoid glycosyltransferase YjiC (YdhE family)|nr:rhamnosyltransferase subunit [Acidobacteriota bacterium]
MKKVIISTFGSFGDLHPYIAIALELKRRGHHPVIATSEIYREKTDALGLELHPVPPDLPGYDQPEEISRMVSELNDTKKGSERVFTQLINPHLREMYDALAEATRGADLLLTHILSLAAPPLVEKTGIKWVSSVLAPISFFSVHDPPLLPNAPWLYHVFKLGPSVARSLMRVARWKLDELAAPLYRLRAELGLPRGGNPMLEGQHSPTLVLALFSSVIAKPQADWPPHTRVTGFPFYDRRDRPGDAAQQGLDPKLAEFLNAGEPPVIFTLGSSAIWVAEDFYRESIKAARAVGTRALLLIGEERNRPAEALPEGIAAFDYAPYSEVLPRARAVVHQGGIGTTAQGLRAGIPSLVVPFSHDQFDNGARVARCGAGRMLPRSKYNAASTERELRSLLADESYTTRAADVGRQVRAEDGAAAAADAIEDILSG